MIKPTGFREYDARWKYPDEINLPGMTALGLGLGTQMQKMADLEQACCARGQQFISQLAGIVDIATFAAVDGPDTHRVKHSRDPGRGKLSIMSNQCRQMRPIDRWTRFNMALQIVCVQFDKSGRDKIAGAVNGTGRQAVPFSIVCNHAILDGHSTCQHLIGQDKSRVRQTQIALQRPISA